MLHSFHIILSLLKNDVSRALNNSVSKQTRCNIICKSNVKESNHFIEKVACDYGSIHMWSNGRNKMKKKKKKNLCCEIHYCPFLL